MQKYRVVKYGEEYEITCTNMLISDSGDVRFMDGDNLVFYTQMPHVVYEMKDDIVKVIKGG